MCLLKDTFIIIGRSISFHLCFLQVTGFGLSNCINRRDVPVPDLTPRIIIVAAVDQHHHHHHHHHQHQQMMHHRLQHYPYTYSPPYPQQQWYYHGHYGPGYVSPHAPGCVSPNAPGAPGCVSPNTSGCAPAAGPTVCVSPVGLGKLSYVLSWPAVALVD